MTAKCDRRIGQGFDIHRLVPGRRLVLGGVEIAFELGLEGHSDADVLLHAICDALLGAIAAGDIGEHFPNTDPKWKDCDSAVFLRECSAMVKRAGYRVANVDCTVLAERPKLRQHVSAIRAKISDLLGIPLDCVGLKATTMERLGAIGREEGIAAMAVALLAVTD